MSLTISSSVASQLIQAPSASSAKKSGSVSASSMETSDSSKVSKMGDLMKQLDELAQTDPEKFKEVTASVASQLEELASTLSGDEASRVSDMASKFAEAAEAGDSSSLRPSKPPPPPGGGPPPQGANAYAQNQAMSTERTDIRSQLDGILESALASLSQ